MLVKLQVKDFAIMDDIVLQFAPGFNVITGETGAGKSILIDAVDFALGGRTDTGAIRSGAERAQVILTFHVPALLRSELRELLEENETPFDETSIELTRELRANGRTVARLNGEVCKLAVYGEVGSLLMDIHGQTEHLSLLKPKNHVFLLDRFADLEESRGALAEQVRGLREIRRTMTSLRQDDRDRERRIDTLQYQISEIESVRLVEGEENRLREERHFLSNAEKLASLSDDVFEALFGEDEVGNSGIDALNRASLALSKLAALDENLNDDYMLADSLAVQAGELADSVRRYRDKLEISPNRLEEVEERLDAIARLKRKYGDSIQGILDYAGRARAELDDIEKGEERLEALRVEEEKLLGIIGELGKELSAARRVAAQRLSSQIVTQLSHLRMEGTRFEVSILQEEDPDGCIVSDERLAFDATGIDLVEFYMSANPGEPLKPVAKIASGGETARIMLAMKTVLSAADRTPTLIFDEIDQGIGARVGGVVGEKLWGLSDNHQVLCVTHLAQIAGFADTHFRVLKEFSGKRTTTQVAILEPDERIVEMAEMLGSSTETAQQNAQELYEAAFRTKRGEKTFIEEPGLI